MKEQKKLSEAIGTVIGTVLGRIFVVGLLGYLLLLGHQHIHAKEEKALFLNSYGEEIIIEQTREEALEDLIDWYYNQEIRFVNVVDYRDINRDYFSAHITNAERHPDVNPVTLFLASLIIEETDLGKVKITSSCRKAGYHHMSPDGSCSAIDITSVSFTGNLKKDILTYIDKTYEIILFLEGSPVSNKTGFGLYPIYCKNGKLYSNGLIWHIDFRNRMGRWSRVNGRYVGILEGIEVLEDLLDNGCGGVSIDDLQRKDGTI